MGSKFVLGRDTNEIVNAAIARPKTLTADDGRVMDVLAWSTHSTLDSTVRVTAECMVRRQSHQDQPERERDG